MKDKKIKNLTIKDKVKKVAPYLLVGTLSFAGAKMTFSKIIPQTTHPYYKETMDSLGNTSKNVCNKEEEFNENYELKNYIAEYPYEWKYVDGKYQRNYIRYETEMSKKEMEYIVDNGEGMLQYFERAKIETEKRKKQPERMEHVPYIEAVRYEEDKRREIPITGMDKKVNDILGFLLSITIGGIGIGVKREVEQVKEYKKK